MHKFFNRSFSKLIIKEPQVCIANGMRLVARSVQTTLGPSGRNVAIDPFSPELHTSTHGLHSDAKPLVTKDGVTVATNMRRLQTNNQLTRLGVQLMIDASERTNEESGDGTTTTCVIASAIISEARRIQSDPIKVRRGLKLGVKAICEQLDTMAVQVKNESDVRNLALISSNNDKGIADVLARVYSEVGLNGAISIQDGDGTHRETTVEFVSGL